MGVTEDEPETVMLSFLLPQPPSAAIELPIAAMHNALIKIFVSFFIFLFLLEFFISVA